MKNATNLRLVVSNSCVDLFEKCMRTDPLLRLFDEPKLRHLLHGILGEPPYQNFADYCNATLKRKVALASHWMMPWPRLQKTTSSPSSRRYLLGHLKFPALYVSKLNLASRPI